MFNLRGLIRGGKNKTKKPKGIKHKGVKPKGLKHKGLKPKGLKPKGTKHKGLKPKGTKHKGRKKKKKSSKRKKSSARKKAGEIINEYALVKIPGDDVSYELGIVLEKDSSDQYHKILFENGEIGEVIINKVELIENQDKNFKLSKINKEISEYIKAFNKVLLTYKDPTIPGTGSQSGEMIEKGVPFYENKIRFDVFAAAANGRPFREEIMNVISCCKEYQTLGECVHKDIINCT
jgi:hypothetical protein